MKLAEVKNLKPIQVSIKIPKTKNQLKSNNPAQNSTLQGLNCLAVYNKANISFKGYCGDKQPAKKLFWILTGRNSIYRDEDINNSAWRVETRAGQKAWSTIAPWDLLKRTPEQAIQGICTLNNTYYIPDYILSPNYGDNWGRRANYLELNPRLLAKAEGNKK